ncbi:MAG TPA: type II secretion system F family protein [Opitutaceae bacterium]|nr:type II secretion system F family protein [Opitutaceae bacterium]
MPRYSYTARDRAGRPVAADLEASSRKDALRVLAARGLTPVSVNETVGDAGRRAPGPAKVSAGAPEAGLKAPTAESLAKSRIRRARSSTLSRKQRLPFLQALSDLTGSGLSAGEAVRLLSQRLQEPALRKLCQSLWERLSEGQPLSRAMAEYAGVFDSSTVNLIQAGEATGSLNDVLQRLIQHFTEQRELRQKLATAMAYPAFICCFAIGVIVFFIFGLLPRIESLLSALGGKLPLATRLLIDTSHFFISYGAFALLALALAAISFWRWRHTEAGRVRTDAWALRLPVAGSFVTTATVMNFSQTLAVLIENGITTAEALRMTERVIANRTHRQAFAEATAHVLEGESLSLALARTGCFPNLVLDRLAVGENTGNVVPSLKEIGRTYQRELSRRLQAFTAVVSTSVLLFAFGFVGFLGYAIFSAVFSLSASFKF